MNQVKIFNQQGYESLPKEFSNHTDVIIDAKKPIYEIKSVPKNASITLTGNTLVENLYTNINIMRGYSKVNVMWKNSYINQMVENSQVHVMRENSQVNEMSNNSQINMMREYSKVNKMERYSKINEMWDSSQVNIMLENSYIREMRNNSQVKEMQDYSQVNRMWNSSQVNIMRRYSQVNGMWDCSQVNRMFGNSQVHEMREHSQVNVALETTSIKAYSPQVTILRLKHQSTLICHDCVVEVKKMDDTVNIISTKKMFHTKQAFLEIYRDNMIDNEHIMLYKSVNPDGNFDYYSDKIKYEGIVECPDWDDNYKRECGGGLHLSPTPELALYHNKGKVLKCKVNIKDFVVYPHNINKVRCKKVEVLGEE